MKRRLPALLAVALVLLGSCAAGKSIANSDAQSHRTVAIPVSTNLPSGEEAQAQQVSPSQPYDPAKSLNLQPKPRIIYDTAQCPPTAPECERHSAPDSGDGKFYDFTNYYEGSPEVMAGAALAGWSLPKGQGFIKIDSKIYPLPTDKGVPTLKEVADGKAFFITSTGDVGTVELVNGTIVFGN